MRTGFSVMEAMTRRPVYVEETETVQSCAKKMQKADVGSVMITKDKKLLGIVTEQDIVYRLVAANKDPKKLKVKDIMTKKCATIQQHVDIYDALVIMRDKDVRTLPVLSQSKDLIGVLTVKDVLKIEPDLFDLVADKWEIREAEKKPVFGQAHIEFVR